MGFGVEGGFEHRIDYLIFVWKFQLCVIMTEN